MVGEEPHLPYTRPPLSKEVLAGEHEVESVHFPCDTLDAQWRLGVSATSLDRARRRVVLSDGDEVPYDRLILATGSRARRWPGAGGELEGVHVLRNLDDGIALRAALEQRPRVAIVGAGFIGCEVAQTARKQGLDVTLIDIAPTPMLPLGPELGEWCAALHRDHGVDLRLGTGVAALHGAGSGRGGRADRRFARRRGPRRRRAGRAPEHGVAGRQRLAIESRARMRRDADGRRRPRHPRRRRHRVVAASPGRRRRDPDRALDRRCRAWAAGRPQRPPVSRTSASPTTNRRTSGRINTTSRSSRSACPGVRVASSSWSRRRTGLGSSTGASAIGRLVGVIAINAARRLGSYRMALADPPDFEDLRAERSGRRHPGGARRAPAQ